jgi:hypothetical protein
VHVLGNIVVSVLLPVIELLRSGACSHLVSFPLNVGLDDLENVAPIVTVWKLSSISSFTLFFLGKLHVHMGLGGGKGDGGVKLLLVGARVAAAVGSSSTLSTTQASLLLLEYASECITKYELEILI